MSELDPSRRHLAPPRELLERQVQNMVRRRFETAPEPLTRNLVGTTAERIKSYVEIGGEYSLVSFYPLAEASKLHDRVRRFGQAFPGLFNINETPRAHDMRSTTRPRRSYIGAVKTRSLAAPLLIGSTDFRSVIISDCFLQVMPDTSVAISALQLRSERSAETQFKYKIYFTFVMAFGTKTSHYDFLDQLECTCAIFRSQ
jgi:hypothetical protein